MIRPGQRGADRFFADRMKSTHWTNLHVDKKFAPIEIAVVADLFSTLSDPAEVYDAVEKARGDIRYVVTDFSFELLVSKFKDEAAEEGDIYVPSYQRKLAWTGDKKSYLIESLLLRVPVPPIFFYDVKGRLEIVDGSQRLRSMVAFSKNEFALNGLEKLDVLNGYRFSDLPVDLQRRLNNTPIRAFVLDQGTDESDRADLFRRLNTSGKGLEDAEVRKGVFPGKFLDLVLECAKSPEFLAVTPVMGGSGDHDSERQELVTRFFVYVDRYRDFRHDVRKFLDAAMQQFNKQLRGLRSIRCVLSSLGRWPSSRRITQRRFIGQPPARSLRA